jgi:hypothetical protein
MQEILPEKLTVPQLVNKFPHFMEPEGSSPLSQINPLHASPSQFNIILPSTPKYSKVTFLVVAN